MTEGSAGFDLGSLMASAQAMQQQIQEVQSRNFTGSAGGGLVQVEISGDGTLNQVQISPEAVDLEDLESLGDLVVAAARDAQSKIKDQMSSAMPQLPDLSSLGF